VPALLKFLSLKAKMRIAAGERKALTFFIKSGIVMSWKIREFFTLITLPSLSLLYSFFLHFFSIVPVNPKKISSGKP
jgi:hypothetical protein